MSEQKPGVKLIDYKNVKVSLLAAVICFVISNGIYFAILATSLGSVQDNFSSDAFEAKVSSYAWADRLSSTFNALFFISLFYLLLQIVQFYRSQPKK